MDVEGGHLVGGRAGDGAVGRGLELVALAEGENGFGCVDQFAHHFFGEAGDLVGRAQARHGSVLVWVSVGERRGWRGGGWYLSDCRKKKFFL